MQSHFVGFEVAHLPDRLTMEKSKDDDEVNNNELQNSKSVKEMSKQELESYRHTPETELSVLVCKAAETDSYADLKDYLEV